ncbi:outer membrane protein iml2 [Talaromyces proteolyticus]|uniref:Inclusion body clearance protein IML2 n=1 Tax=Talaromyces proteolyticus TaxID=1131652 RepID=A0AAD4KKM9_9EURO|nr:outer membrane protein iml2 [Talaromyces proteolyticus]KAH8693178.1 outer membrane protein iml2 [Talaromyces proteolyticus]
MYRMGSWLYGRNSANSSSQSLDSVQQILDLEQAMAAATLILNDDVEGAESGLSEGDSTFHKTGKGVVGFIRATLGFEQEIMRQAAERLAEAENSAYNDHQRVIHVSSTPNAFRSQIYDPGTEYALCQAMVQLLAAVVGVLNESLTESLKGFYKMRKAYMTLDGILKMEERYLQNKRSKSSPLNGLASESNTPSTTTSSAQSPNQSSQDLAKDIAQLKIVDENSGDALLQGPNVEDFSNPIDIFIHSNSNACFGMLLVMLSMIPPTFSRLLAIIGFRGDKERGLRMLWQASKFHSLVGAIAALALLGYYNGFVRFCDIIPDVTTDDEAGIEGYPVERLSVLLQKMRARYPKSQLWLLEESRMKGANRDLESALELLKNSKKSPLKQVDGLQNFEKSMDAMYLHRYEECASFFIKCVELNSWSPALYYYIAGSAYVVLYRQTAATDATAAKEYAKQARECLRKAPTLAGKKRLMARQLPFDVFVTRKVARWETRAKEWNVDLVEAAAAGVDPIEEMIFFWNGYSRMRKEELEESLEKLAWSESDANKLWSKQNEDEKAILSVLRAGVLRSLRRHREAKQILQKKVFSHDRSLFKGHLQENWILPVAHFEMAANLWMERPNYVAAHSPSDSALKPTVSKTSGPSLSETESDILEREMVQECEEHLEKVAKWESYDLDTRIGLKVTSAKGAVRKWHVAHPAAV